MYEQIDPQTLQALIQMAQQQQTGGAAPAATSASSSTPTALAGASTVANIWAGYQADKAADRAAKIARDNELYARKKTEEETARRTRRDLKGETASDAANSMGYLDWLNKRFTPGVQ